MDEVTRQKVMEQMAVSDSIALEQAGWEKKTTDHFSQQLEYQNFVSAIRKESKMLCPVELDGGIMTLDSMGFESPYITYYNSLSSEHLPAVIGESMEQLKRNMRGKLYLLRDGFLYQKALEYKMGLKYTYRVIDWDSTFSASISPKELHDILTDTLAQKDSSFAIVMRYLEQVNRECPLELNSTLRLDSMGLTLDSTYICYYCTLSEKDDYTVSKMKRQRKQTVTSFVSSLMYGGDPSMQFILNACVQTEMGLNYVIRGARTHKVFELPIAPVYLKMIVLYQQSLFE